METTFDLPQLAALVNGWAGRLAMDADPYDPATAAVLEEMTAFVATINGVVASDNVANSNGFESQPIQTCTATNNHPPHRYMSRIKFACPGLNWPPMVPEDV